MVHLVHHQNHRPTRATQLIRQHVVQVGNPCLNINHHQQQIRLLHGGLDLTIDRPFHGILAPFHKAPGVDQREGLTVPFHHGTVTIPGNTRHIVHNSFARSGQAVKQGGFSNIGSAYNSNNTAHGLGGWLSCFIRRYNQST